MTLASCSGEQDQTGGRGGPTKVGYVVVQPSAVPLLTEVGGRTVAFETSEVRPQVNGLIRRRNFTEGSNVRQGQPLFQIDASLRAANAEIGAARAALFPTISLTGLLGLASSVLTGIFSGGAFKWSTSAKVAYPIFRAGAGRALVAQTEAQRNAALASYEKAIQSAFREVADALADRDTIGEQLRSTQANLTATADTVTLVSARYRGGIDPYLTMLGAQRSLYAAERNRV